jgi:histidyl-tRNA synthetase
MAGILKFLDTGAIDPDASPAEIAASAGIAPSENATAAIAKLQAFGGYLKAFGIADWCRYDTGIVRGLAYYTGIVYEVMDVGETLRAIAGGGRYDNLLEVLGGPAVAASGFGMGDVVLGILLEEKQLIGDLAQGVELFVIDGSADMFSDVINVVGRLRSVGAAAEFSYKRQNIGKQLKQADRRGACKAVILEPDGVVMIKDLASGEQTACKLAEILSDPTTIL